MPTTWELKLVDCNVREVTDNDWDWADLVIFSGMIVHRANLRTLIQTAKSKGKKVAIGGPYATSLSHECTDAGADYLVLDEGEITIPLFVEAIEQGAESGTFRSNGEKPDVTNTLGDDKPGKKVVER